MRHTIKISLKKLKHVLTLQSDECMEIITLTGFYCYSNPGIPYGGTRGSVEPKARVG